MRTAVRRLGSMAGVLLALTVGVSTTAFAADDVPTVDVIGSVVDTDGQPAEVERAYVEEFGAPDSEPIRTDLDVADDGTFTVALREWGTPDSPASARFTAFGITVGPVEEGDCIVYRQPWGTVELTIPGQVPNGPIVIVLDQVAESALCGGGLTATPERTEEAPAVTLPPTDSAGGARPASMGWAAAVISLGGIALLAVALLLVWRRRVPAARTTRIGR